MRRSWMSVLLLLLGSAAAMAQSWSAAYDKGLAAAKAGNWADARAAFKQAVAYRPEDQSSPTILPGPISEQRKWRDGAPYSPNFLAAYAGFKQAFVLSGEDRSKLLNEIAPELEILLAKGQNSYETFYVLITTYTSLGATEQRMKVDEKFTAANGKINWKVDREGMTPEDVASVASSFQQAIPAQGNQGDQGAAGNVGTGNNPTVNNPNQGAPLIGSRVTPIATKFALIIGNSTSAITGAEIPFGADDAQRVREALVMSAGYPEENIEIVLNATAAQIQASVKALAARVTDESTVFVFFAGNGANISGKDYLAGVDTAMGTDTSTMISKMDVYQPFLAHGARVFAFFETNRPIVNGRYFGAEVPLIGRIAQTQATIPGGTVQSYVRNGKAVGIFADSMSDAIFTIRSSSIPIMEFGWKIFDNAKRGGAGTQPGAISQTPTLPVLINLASDARF